MLMIARRFGAFLCNHLGNESDIFIGEQFQTLGNHPVLDILFADNSLFAFLSSGIFTVVVMILVSRFSCAAVAHYHLLAVAAE